MPAKVIPATLAAQTTTAVGEGLLCQRTKQRPFGKRKKAQLGLSSQANAGFRSILPEEIEWKPFSAFPSPVRLAVVVGHPSEPSPYAIRVKVGNWGAKSLVAMLGRFCRCRFASVVGATGSRRVVRAATGRLRTNQLLAL